MFTRSDVASLPDSLNLWVLLLSVLFCASTVKLFSSSAKRDPLDSTAHLRLLPSCFYPEAIAVFAGGVVQGSSLVLVRDLTMDPVAPGSVLKVSVAEEARQKLVDT